ncbi:MAG: cytochrome c oxidase subunit II [Chloroflexota bacterium]
MILLSAASRYAESVDDTMTFIVVVSSVLLIGITITMIYFVYRYSRKRNPVAKQIHGSAVLETAWVILPLIIVMVMFWYGYKDYRQLAMQSKNARIVRVTARMWKWTFEYNNGKQSDTLYLPVGESTRLDMRSLDVNHSFFVPAFRLKEDVLASQTTYLLLQPKETGDYDIACAEYCGTQHSKMYARLRVVTKEQFLNWLSDTTRTTDTTQLNRTNAQPTGERAWNSHKKVKLSSASLANRIEAKDNDRVINAVLNKK